MTNQEQRLLDGCYFDQEAADRAIAFIERYVRPSTTGRLLRLLEWQKDYIRECYGWKTKDGRKLIRRSILSTSKKQGKNLVLVAILLYEMFGGLCPSPFLVSASTSRENSGQVYRELAFSIRNDSKLSKICKCLDSIKEIRCPKLNARYKAFSADSGSAEGENISCLVVDELHAHVSDKLYRSLEYSTIARPDSTMFVISTAGNDQSSLWYDLFKMAQAHQADEIIDTTLQSRIYTAPLESDIEDPATWRLACPSLGVSFSEEDFRKDLERAKQEGSAGLTSFRRYRLNQWVAGSEVYIEPMRFDRCLSPMTDAELQPYPMFVGIDLAQTTDMCSASCVWALPDRKFYVRCHGWVCQEGVKLREQSNLPKYQQFAAEGTVTITPGTAADYRVIKAHLFDLRKRFRLKEVICDQFNALELCAELMAEGITVFRQPQNHRHFNGPTKEFELAITEERVKHDGNRLLRWALSNTRLDIDSYGNCKPSRDKSTDKIDPTIATLMAFARAVTENITGQTRRSVYEDRGLAVLL